MSDAKRRRADEADTVGDGTEEDDGIDGLAALMAQQKDERETLNALKLAGVADERPVLDVAPLPVVYCPEPVVVAVPRPVPPPVVAPPPAPAPDLSNGAGRGRPAPSPLGGPGGGFVFAVPQRANLPGSKKDRDLAAGVTESLVEEPDVPGMVKFLGFVEFMQTNGQTQTEQDSVMHRVCRGEHGERARACFWKEYTGKHVDELPDTNTADKWCLFAGSGSVGSGGPCSKMAVTAGAQLDGTADNPYATLGSRVACAVTTELG